jgi:type I restriction enzyme S subunit
MNEADVAGTTRAGSFGDLVDLVRAKVAPTLADTRLRCVNLEHIQEGSGKVSGWSPASESLSMKTKFESGDILFGKLRPYLRKFAQPSFSGVCTSELLTFRAKAGVCPQYAYQVAGASALIEYCVAASFGTKMPRTDWKTVSAFPVMIPEEAEQRRIAELLASIDELVAESERRLDKLAALKAGLVRDALGRLVHAPLEPLAKVAVVAGGVTLGRVFVGPDTAEYPYLRVANVQDGHIDLSDVKTLRLTASAAARAMLRPGDVLMNEGGDFDKLGRGAVWRGEIPNCLHQNHVFRVRCDQAVMLPEFLALWAASEFGKKFFMLASKQSTNLASINSTQLKKFPVLRPSLPEQRGVVDVVGALESSLAADKQELAKLRLLKVGLARSLLT